jgi:hypothetical protein
MGAGIEEGDGISMTRRSEGAHSISTLVLARDLHKARIIAPTAKVVKLRSVSEYRSGVRNSQQVTTVTSGSVPDTVAATSNWTGRALDNVCASAATPTNKTVAQRNTTNLLVPVARRISGHRQEVSDGRTATIDTWVSLTPAVSRGGAHHCMRRGRLHGVLGGPFIPEGSRLGLCARATTPQSIEADRLQRGNRGGTSRG